MTLLELVHREDLGWHRHVLFLAAGVGKAKVDELDLFLFEHLQHVGWGVHCVLLVEAWKSEGFAAKTGGGRKSQNYAITETGEYRVGEGALSIGWGAKRTDSVRRVGFP